MRIMNLWPEWPWSARRKAATNGGIAASLREGEGMGVWQDIMGKWQPRARNPYLLEALREAIPILDGGISRVGFSGSRISMRVSGTACPADPGLPGRPSSVPGVPAPADRGSRPGGGRSWN